MLRLNVGCGFDYREGFVNIDGSDALPKIDQVIDLGKDRLSDHYEPETVDHILANDFIEHHYHWEAVGLMTEFYTLLRPGGFVEIRVPDVRYIVRSPRFTVEQKIILLYGGQDISQNKGDDVSRKLYPGFFCHKYGYTRQTLTAELYGVGFSEVRTERASTNFVAHATK